VSALHATYERSTLVNSEKYIGLDVHQATIWAAVLDSTGKLVMESILETRAATILQFFAGLRRRSWAIPCAGRDVYYARHRDEWLGKIPHPGPHRRAPGRSRLQGLPSAFVRRRPRHPHPQASQGGVRQRAAMSCRAARSFVLPVSGLASSASVPYSTIPPGSRPM
jgi:hypothetical protein